MATKVLQLNVAKATDSLKYSLGREFFPEPSTLEPGAKFEFKVLRQIMYLISVSQIRANARITPPFDCNDSLINLAYSSFIALH